MPRYLRWLSGSALAFTGLTLAVLVFGPQQGLETLAGGLLAYFCFLYHLAILPVFVVYGIRSRRFSPGFAAMSVYLLVLVGFGVYQVILVNDIDDAARDFLEAQTEPESWQIRQLGHRLYVTYKQGQSIPESERTAWHALAGRAEDLNRRDARHAPALWYAAAMGDADMVDRLLDAGARTEDSEIYGTPPLAAAIEEDHAGVVRRLLDAGADPNAGINPHYPSLSLAARDGRLDIIEVLLASGADPNLGDPTPFALALGSARSDILAVLLDAGAEPVPVRGELPLTVALAQDDPDLVELLLEKTPGFELFSDTRPPLLFQAASSCDLDAFRHYLELGADPDVRDRDGKPLFFHVALLRTRACDLDTVRADLARALIASGAEVNLTNDRNESLVLLALRHDQPDVALALVEAGADTSGEIDKRDFLMLSAALGRDDLVRIAVARGFDPNRWSEGLNRSNALHEAARAGHTGTVRYLIDAGARLPEAEIDQRNLFRFAADHPEALRALLDLYRQESADAGLARVIRRAVTDSGNENAIALVEAMPTD